MKPRKPGNPQLAVAYIRVSTDEQTLGPEAQRAQITTWAARSGVSVVSWHEDRVSGAAPVEDRAGLLDAIAAVAAHSAGLLVAAKRDRVARDVVVAACAERLTRDAGARLVTCDGVSSDDTPEGGLMRGLLDLFGQYERAVIRARTRAALQAKRARGEQFTRKAPLGFRFESGRLIEAPEELAALERIRGMRRDGLSVDRIVLQLNTEGQPCRGGRWHATSIRRVLRREVA